MWTIINILMLFDFLVEKGWVLIKRFPKSGVPEIIPESAEQKTLRGFCRPEFDDNGMMHIVYDQTPLPVPDSTTVFYDKQRVEELMKTTPRLEMNNRGMIVRNGKSMIRMDNNGISIVDD
jgi:hypothetical protein